MTRGKRIGESPDFVGFRMRGREVTRLETFSDAVFGFALTLLVVSLDVPKNFPDLIATMRGFPAFALCFLFLALLWNGHNRYCRLYGLDDGSARFLTCVLLFLVLFYGYPLKFLFNFSITDVLFGGPAQSVITRSEFSTLLVIYGLGFAAVYLAMLLLYLHAYRMRDALELTALEVRYALPNLSAGDARRDENLAALLACVPPNSELEQPCLHPSISHPADVAHHSPPPPDAVSRRTVSVTLAPESDGRSVQHVQVNWGQSGELGSKLTLASSCQAI